MTCFDEAAGRISDTETVGLTQILNQWMRRGLGREIVRNIRSERFLRTNCMERILRALLGPNTLPEVERSYQQECYKHILKGGPIGVRPRLVGRAVEYDLLRNRLCRVEVDGRLVFPTPQVVDEFIVDLLRGTELIPEHLMVPLSDHSAWITWDPDDSSADPFRFAGDADHIRASLGLDLKWWACGRLILLVYAATNVTLYRPTIADAGLYPMFEPPPPPEDRYGLTKVWHLPHQKQDPTPRPEAVHKPVTIQALDRRRTRDLR